MIVKHLWLLSLLLSFHLSLAFALEPAMTPLASSPAKSSLFEFNSTWQILGPFQIGTREATWGADPLEYHGGFQNLTYDPKAAFRSSLPTNGSAKWNLTEAVQTSSTTTSANASLSVGYSNVNWDFLNVVYGWAAVQYQVWARGELIVHGNVTQSLILYTDAILEFWVDDVHYFGGDFFTFRKAPPVLHLAPGSHKIDLRLARDVRAFGGILAPTIDVVVEVRQAADTLELAKPGILMSDVVDGRLPSSVGAIFLRNSGQQDVEILGVRSANVSSTFSFAEQDLGTQAPVGSTYEVADTDEAKDKISKGNSSLAIVLVAGQTRSVVFNITLPISNASAVAYDVVYKQANDTHEKTLHVTQDLNRRSIYQSHQFTYRHPGGIASYAMLRPPAQNATCRSAQEKVPVLLALHGAGVEVNNSPVNASFNAVPDLCAWLLFPTGVTSWSSDDWHNWGFADVEAAVQAIPTWVEQADWNGHGVDIDRWIVTGHSNGGQGTWYTATHRPDKVLAAAPVSGYASIQKYVPYELWQPADPGRTAIISASMNSYRHEMLMENLRGIPIQQQHGEIDDNVPAYNSRLLAQQLSLAGTNCSYNEVPGQNHYWDTVMTTPELVDFYHTQLRNEDVLPRRLKEFEMVVGDPGDMGSKGGIRVLQLTDPGQYGRVEVQGHFIRTTNVQSLEFDPSLWNEPVTIDGNALVLDFRSTVAHQVNDEWNLGTYDAATLSNKRAGRQLGSMAALLRSHGPFLVRYEGGTNTSQVALQVSRNLHQYFQADSVILPMAGHNSSKITGNIISLVVNKAPPNLSDFPIQVGEDKCSVRTSNGQLREYGKQATGATFLRPLNHGALELVVWGANEDGLRQAARIVPMLTGVGQPDFVVFGKSARWKGIEGALAMGFFDSQWQVTASSVVSGG